MSALTLAPGTIPLGLPTDDHYARNLVDGVWRFPAAPYEYEIRNPADSTITTVVPLSSRFDVSRAVAAAAAAAPGWAGDADRRAELLGGLVDALELLAPQLAALQAVETGLGSVDSVRATHGAIRQARAVIDRGHDHGPGVTAHVLSWGLPVVEAVGALVPQLAAGHTVVVKPSLRAPLSAVAFAHLATELGFPPGVVNVVQGTGEDVGAALCGTRGLALLHVRAGERTLAQASRAVAVTGVPLRGLRAGGNIAVAGRDTDPAAVAGAIADAVRVHSTGGPLGLPTLAVHVDVADQVLDAVLAALSDVSPAPLPSETLRRRALTRFDALSRNGTARTGGTLPDDIHHRMGWFMPPAVLCAATDDAPAGGPVLTVRTWRDPADLAGVFAHARHTDGIACSWGLDPDDLAAARLPHPVVVRESGLSTALDTGRLPSGWTAGSGAEVTP